MAEQTQTVLERNTTAFYEALYAASKDEEFTATTLRVFRGNLTDVFKSLGISQSYYSRIRKVLLEHECIQYIDRGGRSNGSVVVLDHPPPATFTTPRLTPAEEAATLESLSARIQSLEARLANLTGGLNIVQALKNHEDRLAQLEHIADTES